MELNDTNRPLTETAVENTPSVSVPLTEETENVTSPAKLTKEEIIQRLKEINEDACNADKQEIDSLKQNFYKLHKAEQETARKAFIEQGGKAEDFTPATDPLEAEFKQVMSAIKEKRNALTAAQEQEKKRIWLKNWLFSTK